MQKLDILLKFLITVALFAHIVLFFQYLYPNGKTEDNEVHALNLAVAKSQIEANQQLISFNDKYFALETELLAEIKAIRNNLEGKSPAAEPVADATSPSIKSKSN